MVEEPQEKLSQESDATSTTPGEIAEALAAVRASSPSLGAALDAAGLTPDELVDAHDRATSDQDDAAKPILNEGDERG